MRTDPLQSLARLLTLILLALSISGCGDSASPPAQPEAEELTVSLLTENQWSPLADPEEGIITDAAALEALLARLGPYSRSMPADLDFEREMVVFVALGKFDRGGYSVEIEQVSYGPDGAIVVVVGVESPDAEEAGADPCSPFALARVPRRDGTPRFEYRGRRPRILLEVILPAYSFAAADSVPITVRATNRSRRAVSLVVPTSQIFDVVVRSEGRPIWSWSNGLRFLMMFTELRLDPGESRDFTAVWRGEGSDDGNGHFSAVGMIGNAEFPELRSRPAYFSRGEPIDPLDIRRPIVEYFGRRVDTRDVFDAASIEILSRRDAGGGRIIAQVRFRTLGMGHPSFFLEAIEVHTAEVLLEPDPRMCPTCGGLWVTRAVCDHGGTSPQQTRGDWFYSLGRYETYDFGQGEHPVCPHADRVPHPDPTLDVHLVRDWPDNSLETLYCDDEDLYFTASGTIAGPIYDGPFLGRLMMR